jgi:hypothetical protein
MKFEPGITAPRIYGYRLEFIPIKTVSRMRNQLIVIPLKNGIRKNVDKWDSPSSPRILRPPQADSG